VSKGGLPPPGIKPRKFTKTYSGSDSSGGSDQSISHIDIEKGSDSSGSDSFGSSEERTRDLLIHPGLGLHRPKRVLGRQPVSDKSIAPPMTSRSNMPQTTLISSGGMNAVRCQPSRTSLISGGATLVILLGVEATPTEEAKAAGMSS
jgi:hypothetical protein